MRKKEYEEEEKKTKNIRLMLYNFQQEYESFKLIVSEGVCFVIDKDRRRKIIERTYGNDKQDFSFFE
jgi:hypothetical protein